MNGGTSLRAGRRQQAPGTVSQCRIQHRYLLSDPCPRLAAFRGLLGPVLLGHISYRARRQSLKIASKKPICRSASALRKNASKLTAVVTAASLAAAPMPALAQGKGPARSPRYRDRAVAARLHPADPARRRPGKAEHPDGHHQRQRLQRLRRRRPPHLRELRRDDAVGNAEPDHRRAGARNRPSRRRPSRPSCASNWRRRRPR